MNRWTAVIAAGLCVALAGCNNEQPKPGGTSSPAGQTTGKPKPVIGVSLLTMANPFFKEIADAMQAEGRAKGYDVVVTAGENDAAKQSDQVKDFVARKVAAIVLSPCDSRSVAEPIKEANKAGIPVFTADIACMDPSAKVVTHVATDNYEGGKMAAKAMIEALGGKGKIAIIDHPEVESGMLRTKGFKEVIATTPGIQIVAQLPGGGMRDASFKTAQDILEKNPQLDGIFAINDPSALGVIAALEKAGRLAKVKVVGFDGQVEARQAIKDGKMYADAVQYPEKIGKMTVDAIGDYMAGQQQKPQTLIATGLYKKADADKDPALK